MKSILLGIALLAFIGVGVAQAQSTGYSTQKSVVSQCTIVANNQIRRDRSTDGLCIKSVGVYLTILKKASPGDLNNLITKLVVKLAVLPQLTQADCQLISTEIAQAIEEAGTFSTDPDQVARLLEIAATVSDCTPEITAAVDSNPSGG